MSIALSTAGIAIKYAPETVAGTRPTGTYTTIAGIKSVSDLNPSPNAIDSTTFDDLVWKTYENGLKDFGGAITFTANFTDTFKTAWGTLCTAAGSAEGSGFAIWFEVYVPGLTKGFFFPASPSSIGMPAATVDSLIEIQARVSPTGAGGWFAKI